MKDTFVMLLTAVHPLRMPRRRRPLIQEVMPGALHG
jgi:hypothetical protein